MKCTECNSDDVTIILQKFKNNRYKFRVECNRCGCFSHYLKLKPLELAVKTYIEEHYGTERK